MLSVIIVNYFSETLIINCIESIHRFSNSEQWEIIVVSNGSDPLQKAELLSHHPHISWIETGYNAGFARANNAGMRAAKGDAFLLLNPDTLAVDDSIEKCYSMLLNSSFAAAGVQIYDREGNRQISGSRFVKGGLNHLLPIPYWGNFIRWMAYKNRVPNPNIEVAAPVSHVDWISGAFLMVKRSAVESAGYMDEDFFLYGEEVEWCSRIGKVGTLCLFGDLQIIHLEGATINKTQQLEEKGYYNLYDKKGLQLMVSNHLRVRKQFGTGWFLILLLNYTFGVVVFATGALINRISSDEKPKYEWKKVSRFAENVISLWKLAPKMISNKPYFYKVL